MRKKSTFMESARDLLRLGIPVIPVSSDGSTPLVADWDKAATTDRRQIKRWAKRWPDAQAGLSAEHLPVLEKAFGREEARRRTGFFDEIDRRLARKSFLWRAGLLAFLGVPCTPVHRTLGELAKGPTTDLHQIEEWDRLWPDALAGVPVEFLPVVEAAAARGDIVIKELLAPVKGGGHA